MLKSLYKYQLTYFTSTTLKLKLKQPLSTYAFSNQIKIPKFNKEGEEIDNEIQSSDQTNEQSSKPTESNDLQSSQIKIPSFNASNSETNTETNNDISYTQEPSNESIPSSSKVIKLPTFNSKEQTQPQSQAKEKNTESKNQQFSTKPVQSTNKIRIPEFKQQSTDSQNVKTTQNTHFDTQHQKSQHTPRTKGLGIQIPDFKKPSAESEKETDVEIPQRLKQDNRSSSTNLKFVNQTQQQKQQESLPSSNFKAGNLDKFLRQNFGESFANQINQESNKRILKPYSHYLQNIGFHLYDHNNLPFDYYEPLKFLADQEGRQLKQKTSRYRYQKNDKYRNQTNFFYYQNKSRQGQHLDVDSNEIIPIPNDWQSKDIIPRLENNLDFITKCPGIFPVESLNIYNQGKLGDYFTRIPQYSQINEDAITPYFRPGEDQNLKQKAIQYNCKYIMSTSTVTSVLSHIYFALSNFKSPHFNNLSEPYDREPLKFMISQRKPNTVFLTKVDKSRNIYSVDGDSGFSEPSNVVLLKMGKYMEKMLTTDAQTFRDYYVLDLETNKPKKYFKEVSQEQDYFKYLKAGNIMLRSQIDCQGEDQDGNNIVFELKTRATAVIRYDINQYIDYLDYEIHKFRGQHSSYEREYYDLIRGGFLKYIMQCKIGQMSGAMIAYHNTQKIFGFEYIPLEVMEKRVFGCKEFSDIIFKTSLTLCEKILDFILEDQDITEIYNFDKQGSGQGKGSDGQTKLFRIGFYANEQERNLNVFVEVFENDIFYQERFKSILPEYMVDPIDYYIQHKIQPQVYKYQFSLSPFLNGMFVDFSPILFEKGDTLEVKYIVQRYGKIDFNEYMRFLHEAYKSESINVENEYTGSWSFMV